MLLSGALIALPLLVYALATLWTRPLADDYCWRAWVNEAGGYWDFQTKFYETYTERWANTAALSLAGYLGTSVAPYLLSLSFLAWLLSTAWCAYELTKKILLSIVVAEAIVVSTLFATPGNARDVVYWLSGMVAYLAPVVILTTAIALAARLRAPYLLAAGAFLATAFNESFMLLEILAFALAAVIAPRLRRMAVPALGGAVAGMLTVVLAPGALGRQTIELERGAAVRPDFVAAAEVSLRYAIAYGIVAVATGGLLAYFAGGVLREELHVRLPRWSLFLAIPLLFVVTFPSVSTVGYMSPRTYFPGIVPLVIVTLLAGTNAGWRKPVLVIPLVLLFATLATRNAVTVAARTYDYAQRWDAMNAKLEASRGQDSVLRIDLIDNSVPWIWRIQNDPDWVINRCVATLYDIGAVVGPGIRSGSDDVPGPPQASVRYAAFESGAGRA